MVVQPQSNQQPTEVLNNGWGSQWQQSRAGEIYPSVTIDKRNVSSSIHGVSNNEMGIHQWATCVVPQDRDGIPMKMGLLWMFLVGYNGYTAIISHIMGQ